MESEEDEDTDSQGVELRKRGTRFVSDSLQFTGTDLGDRRSGTLRKGYGRDTDDEESTDEEDDDDYDLALLGPDEKEEALVQTAMMRIQKAQARGRSDVSLSKDELAALERRKQRQQEEAERAERAERKERKKRKEQQRIAVPLTSLEPVSRKKKGSSSALGALDPSADPDRSGQPPMGYFPPPGGRRPRSGTTLSSRPPSRVMDERGSSPFHYEYVQRPGSSAGRHVSDSVARPHSSRGRYHDDSAGSSRDNLDPFQFQTVGSRAVYSSGAVAGSRRHASGPPSDLQPLTRREAAARSTRSSRAYDDSTDEDTDSQSTSDDFNAGARIVREPARATRSEIIVEPAEPEPEPPKKSKSAESVPKRKPVASSSSGSGRGRRKKK